MIVVLKFRGFQAFVDIPEIREYLGVTAGTSVIVPGHCREDVLRVMNQYTSEITVFRRTQTTQVCPCCRTKLQIYEEASW